MTLNTHKVRPLYASTFHCIGAACEETCCDMSVLLDKATYEKYQEIPEGHTRSLVQLHVSLNTVGNSDTLYGKISPTDTNHCPFFATDRLCSMQKQFGAEYLSATCAIYPRVLNSVNDELESSLYLSCPEAARLILLKEDSTEAKGNVTSSHFRTDQFSRMASNGPNSIHKPYAYFDEIRKFFVSLIKNRTRPLWQRLFLMGMTCRDLDQITTPAEDSKVPRILRDYREIIATGALFKEMDDVPGKPAEQLDVVLWLTDLCIRRGASNERFQKCFAEFLQGIGHPREPTAHSIEQRYVQAEAEFYRPLLGRHPHIMENYLLNYVYRTLFPFGRAASAHFTPQGILGEFTLMATQYAMVNGLLIGMAGHHQAAFDTEHVVRLIQSFSKAVEHNPSYLREIKEFIASRNLGTPEGIVILLKSSEVESCKLVTERRPSRTHISARPAIA